MQEKANNLIKKLKGSDNKLSIRLIFQIQQEMFEKLQNMIAMEAPTKFIQETSNITHSQILNRC
jgi:hypothetical protein